MGLDQAAGLEVAGQCTKPVDPRARCMACGPLCVATPSARSCVRMRSSSSRNSGKDSTKNSAIALLSRSKSTTIRECLASGACADVVANVPVDSLTESFGLGSMSCIADAFCRPVVATRTETGLAIVVLYACTHWSKEPSDTKRDFLECRQRFTILQPCRAPQHYRPAQL